MLQDLLDSIPLRDITIEHLADQVDTLIADNVGNTQVAIHNLVNAVERVLLVDDGVEEDTESPDVLLLATVGLAGEDFGGGVICRFPVSLMLCREEVKAFKRVKAYQWYPQTHQRVRS